MLENQPTPGLPVIDEPDMITPADVFTMHYRKNNDILSCNFHFVKPSPEMNSKDHFRAAVNRAKVHCERMRYRFLFCRPYIVNLEEEEMRMAI